MTIEAIELWHKRARPDPTDKDFNVQLGCHFEEIVEMMDTIKLLGAPSALSDAREVMHMLADWLKKGVVSAQITNRKEFLDSIADQVVTGVGAAYCAGMKGAHACKRVNTSNWSKFDENGRPIRDQNGKITKGPNYQSPVLDGLY